MPSATLATGNGRFDTCIQVPITPPISLAAGATVTSTYTIQGLQVGDVVTECFQAAQPVSTVTLSIWVSANNTLSVQWYNGTAGASSGSPIPIVALFEVFRPEVQPAVGNLPSSIF
jgi:hypothetical protein